MSLLSRLERRFGRFAVPNVTAIIVAGQVLLYVANQVRAAQGERGVDHLVDLNVPQILQGEAWRLVTFAFAPPPTRVILFAFFGWMLFYLFGSTLERLWGAFRYNMFLLTGLLANIAAALIGWYAWGMPEPGLPPTVAIGQTATAANVLLYGSVFLAFARVCPDMIINLFFVLPIKIKWLALVAWIAYGFGVVRYGWPERLFIAASLLNYALFFGRDHLRDFKQGRRRRAFQSAAKHTAAAATHKCRVCGLNSADSPKTLFRYCSKCAGQVCYCPEHIRDHEHVGADEPAAT